LLAGFSVHGDRPQLAILHVDLEIFDLAVRGRDATQEFPEIHRLRTQLLDTAEVRELAGDASQRLDLLDDRRHALLEDLREFRTLIAERLLHELRGKFHRRQRVLDLVRDLAGHFGPCGQLLRPNELAHVFEDRDASEQLARLTRFRHEIGDEHAQRQALETAGLDSRARLEHFFGHAVAAAARHEARLVDRNLHHFSTGSLSQALPEVAHRSDTARRCEIRPTPPLERSRRLSQDSIRGWIRSRDAALRVGRHDARPDVAEHGFEITPALFQRPARRLQPRRHIVERSLELADLVSRAGPQAESEIAARDAPGAFDETAHRIENARREEDTEHQRQHEHERRQTEHQIAGSFDLDRELIGLQELRHGERADAYAADIFERQIAREIALLAGRFLDDRITVAAQLHMRERLWRYE
jgi:hypothetical protein